MEQLLEHLVAAIEKMGAKIDTNQKQMKTGQEHPKEEMRAGQEHLKEEMLAKMETKKGWMPR
jgi:DNA polymerase II large subunit